LVHELREKFQLDPIKRAGVLALTASLDLRSRGLTYLLTECKLSNNSQARTVTAAQQVRDCALAGGGLSVK